MKVLTENMKNKFSFLKPFLPYGVLEPGDSLDPKLYYSIHEYWLKFYGMWFNSSSSYGLVYWLQSLYTCIVLFLACLLPGFGEMFYSMKRREDVGDLAEGLYLFLSEMYTYFKVAVFWSNKDKVINLLQYLSCEEFKPVEAEHKKIILKSIKSARSVTTYFMTWVVSGISVGIILPMTENFNILPTNVEYPYVDVMTSPAYQILYIHHIYYKPATCIIDVAMDTILAAFVCSAIGQIEILVFNLTHFDMVAKRRRDRMISTHDSSGEYSMEWHVKAVLKDCIKHHNCIIKYVSIIESAFSVASALQIMLSVMVLCLVGIQFLSIENPSSRPMQIMWVLVYLSCMLTEVFILCWFGDALIWKSESLREAAFKSPWVGRDHNTMVFIVIFLERCKQPLKVTAGKIFTLSLETYTLIINWAYKAFAVVSKMKK